MTNITVYISCLPGRSLSASDLSKDLSHKDKDKNLSVKDQNQD